jgi:tRNA pseudouridine32 synthase/23S rRNA pseudouridine746 synthase
MPPRSPLPQRHGLNAAWARTDGPDSVPPGFTMGDWLRRRFGDKSDVDAMLAQARFVYADASPVLDGDAFRRHSFVWFHRDLREEVPVPGDLHVLHRDERILVVDKPAFLATIPRGNHVTQSVVVRLRAELGLPELSPVHRLDRITSGVLLLTVERRWRGAYQVLFEDRLVRKTYRALAFYEESVQLPVTVRNHLRKARGCLQAEVVGDAEPNAETLVEVEEVRPDGLALYRLTPRTGKTHQLRVHLNGLGVPILNDPLYPDVTDTSIDDFSAPLQLLASELAFTDPVDGTERVYRSRRRLPL